MILFLCLFFIFLSTIESKNIQIEPKNIQIDSLKLYIQSYPWWKELYLEVSGRVDKIFVERYRPFLFSTKRSYEDYFREKKKREIKFLFKKNKHELSSKFYLFQKKNFWTITDQGNTYFIIPRRKKLNVYFGEQSAEAIITFRIYYGKRLVKVFNYILEPGKKDFGRQVSFYKKWGPLNSSSQKVLTGIYRIEVQFNKNFQSHYFRKKWKQEVSGKIEPEIILWTPNFLKPNIKSNRWNKFYTKAWKCFYIENPRFQIHPSRKFQKSSYELTEKDFPSMVNLFSRFSDVLDLRTGTIQAEHSESIYGYIVNKFSSSLKEEIKIYGRRLQKGRVRLFPGAAKQTAKELNKLISAPALYKEKLFKNIDLRYITRQVLLEYLFALACKRRMAKKEIHYLNRLLLEDAFVGLIKKYQTPLFIKESEEWRDLYIERMKKLNEIFLEIQMRKAILILNPNEVLRAKTNQYKNLREKLIEWKERYKRQKKAIAKQAVWRQFLQENIIWNPRNLYLQLQVRAALLYLLTGNNLEEFESWRELYFQEPGKWTNILLDFRKVGRTQDEKDKPYMQHIAFHIRRNLRQDARKQKMRIWKRWVMGARGSLAKIAKEEKILRRYAKLSFPSRYTRTQSSLLSYCSILIRITNITFMEIDKIFGIQTQESQKVDPYAIKNFAIIVRYIQDLLGNVALETKILLKKELGYLPPPGTDPTQQ